MESELRVGQLEGCRVLLGESGVEQTRLGLLTRYPEVIPPGDARRELEMRWYEVADGLESETPAAEETDPVAGFLVRQFVDFLGYRNMTLAQVGKYMPEGLRALSNLMNMVFEAAACKVSVKKRAGWDSIGLNLDGKYWVGVSFSEPEKLWFGTYGRIDREKVGELGSGEMLGEEAWAPGRFRWWKGAELDSESIHFFSRAKVSQMQWLEEFVRKCLERARAIETPGQQPLAEEFDEGHEPM